MILKKPYAFIIKHFKIIHLLLLIPMFYVILKTGAIMSFINNYIRYGYTLNFTTTTTNLTGEFISIFMYLAIIIILITFIALSIVLQQKEKPTRFYNISIIYYIGIFVLLTTCFNILNSIETGTIDEVAIGFIKDIGYIIHYSQYGFLAYTLTRGVGFNIKKFNFQSDIENLEINVEDNEEFEFAIKDHSYEAKRTLRRFIRELKYYYLENKFIFRVIGVIAIIIIGTLIYTNREVTGKVYKENEAFSFSNLVVQVKNSYISNLTNNGKVMDKDKTYVIVELEIKNRTTTDRTFIYGNLGLAINKKTFIADLQLGSYFTDFGNPYSGTLIKGMSDSNYYLVYEIDKYLENSKLSLKAYSHYDNKVGGIGAVNKEIKLRPKKISSNVAVNSIGLGTNINLTTTSLKETKGTIYSYEITNRYEYQVCKKEGSCINDVAYIDYGKDINKTLMVLDYDLNIDPESSYYKASRTYQSFFEDFLEIKYTYNGREYRTNIKLVNPLNYSDKLIMKVPSNINYADSVSAIITVRNVSYEYKLK